MKLLRLWQQATGLWETWFDLTVIKKSDYTRLKDRERRLKIYITEAQFEGLINRTHHIAKNPKRLKHTRRELEAACVGRLSFVRGTNDTMK